MGQTPLAKGPRTHLKSVAEEVHVIPTEGSALLDSVCVCVCIRVSCVVLAFERYASDLTLTDGQCVGCEYFAQ